MLTLLESSGKLKKGKRYELAGVERDMDSLMGCVERIAAFDRRKIIAAGEFDRKACAQYVVHDGPQDLTAIPVGGNRITPAFRRQSTLRTRRNVSSCQLGANLKS